MSKGNKHVVHYDGATFTRTSQNRRYSWLVLSVHTLDDDLRRAVERARYDYKINKAYHERTARGEHSAVHRSLHTAEELMAEEAQSRLWLERGESAVIEEYRKRAEEDFYAHPNNLSTDRTRKYRVAGWSSRNDLAAKVARQHAGFCAETVIVEVQPS